MSDQEQPEKKIHVDSDWKEQVQQEKEKLKGESPDPSAADQPAPEQPSEPTSGPAPEAASQAGSTANRGIPKPDFMLLVSMLGTQAFAALGQIPTPGTPEVKTEPETAKYLIEMLGVLEEKTQGNLTEEEQQGLENILHQARMAFVAVTGRT